MSGFDENFESTRLAQLAQQHPDIVSAKGELVFNAEDNEDYLSGTSWTIDDDIFEKITETGFKIHLIELLDIFIQYRGRCNKLPRKEGVVRFSDGSLTMEWLPDGSTHL